MPRRNPLKVNSDLLQLYVGRWKIVSCYYQSEEETEPQIVDELNHVELSLDEQFDICWHLSVNNERNELFLTTSFEIDESGITFSGNPNGESYSFEVHANDRDTVTLSSDGLVIVLNKVVTPIDMRSFSLVDAFNEGYFSDLIIRSSEGQKFNVHRCVLNVSCPGVKYRDWEMLLSTVSSQGTYATLYYIYTSTLPPNITVGVARELAQVTNGNQKFSHLNGLALACIECNALTNRLQELVDSLVNSLEVARQIITSSKMDDPAKVVYATKQLAREAAIVCCRVVLLCQLYTQNKPEMASSERRHILEYVQGRIIVFVNEGKELLQLLIAKWESLTDIQKSDIALYIIPHVNEIWQQVNEYSTHLHSTLEGQEFIPSLPATKSVSLKLALQFNSSAKDLKHLKKLKDDFKKFVSVGEARRAQFTEWTEEEKVEAIKRLIREITHDAQGFIDRLDSLKKKILLANALDWGSYKLGVSLACSYVSWGLNKILSVKDTIKPLIQKIAHFVGQNEFNSILVQLGVASIEELFDDTQTTVPSLPLLSEGKCVMNSVNLLAKGCGSLLESKEYTDMEFVIQEMTTPTSDHTHNPLDDKCTVISAHRVVLAARSEWFRKALQSGMREDRDRRVMVKDIDVSLFRMFLDYLYGNQMNFHSMNKEELIELLLVADRYETTSLHSICERQLICLVTDDTVFPLLTTADHLNARQLRAHTLQYIVHNPDVLINSIEQYSQLPLELKDEVRQIMSGTQQISQYSSSMGRDQSPPPPLPLESDYNSLLIELRAIVGEESSDDDLKSLLLAADMDINRAVNYYFGAQ